MTLPCVGLLVAGALLLSPIPALAQTSCTVVGVGDVSGSVLGIMSETMESPPAQAAPGGPLLAGTFPRGLGVRLAQATEQGVFLNGCGTLESFNGTVTVHAQSRVPVLAMTSLYIDLGVGSIKGNFDISSTTAGNISGKLDGTLDFSLTNHNVQACPTPSGGLGPCPIVNASGTWTANGVDPAGAFAGVALVPFPCGAPSGLCYFDPTGAIGGGVVPLDPSKDFDLHGAPQAKFIITLFQ